MGVLAALLFAGLVVAGWRRGRVSGCGLLLGTLGFIVAVVATAGVVWVLWQAVIKVYPRYAAVVDTHNSWLYWLACLALAVACFALIYNLLRRHVRVDELVLGASLCWLVPTLALSPRMPGISYWFD